MNCPHCGKALKDGAKFCIYCGEKMESSVPAGAYQMGGALLGGNMPAETARPAGDSDKTISLFELKKEQAASMAAASGMPSYEVPEQKPLPFTDVYGQNSMDINSVPAYDYIGNNSSDSTNSTYDYGQQSYETPSAPASSINNKPLLVIVIILALMVVGIGVYLGIFFAGNNSNNSDKDDDPEEAAVQIEQEGSFGWETLADMDLTLAE